MVMYLFQSLGPGAAPLRAQLLDSAVLKAGTMVSVASQDYQPLWLVSQRWGTLSDQPFDVTSHVSFHNQHLLGDRSSFRNYISSLKKRSAPTLSYGVSLYNNQLLQQTRFQEAYVKVNVHHWQLAAGRYQEVIGEVPALISSGSLGVSGNAAPLPQASLGLMEYTDLPFLAPGWIQVKGQVSVGWLERDAYVQHAKLHHRSFYLQVGKRPLVSYRNRTALSLYGGVNQFVVWAGRHPSRGQLPGQWANLIQPIVPGNNLGFFDYGFTFLSRGIKVRGYTQVPFEGKGNVNPFRIKDRMVGVVVSDTRKGSYVPTITMEAINTTWQDPNPENDSRKEDYNFYNNTVYADGWSYGGRILGTPLFFDRQRATHYFGANFDAQSEYNWNIVNNRINGVHIGVKGRVPFQKIHYRTLATATVNYGNYYIPGLFKHRSRRQFYLMQELTYHYRALKFTGALGADVGGLTKNLGALLGVEYDLYHYIDREHTGPTKYRGRRNMFRRGW